MSVGVLPAQPLVEVVNRLIVRAGATEPNSVERTTVLRDLNVPQRMFWIWRNHPRARVSPDVADRVLSASPYLWFDVWPACEEHKRPSRGCETCHTHYQARNVFTGAPIPTALRRAS